MSGRLAQARKQLQQRLTRRGVTLSAALCAAALTESAASAVSPVLVAATSRAALEFAAGKLVAAVSGQVLAVAEGVLKTMLATKLKIATVVLLAVGVAGGSVGLLAQQVLVQRTVAASAKAERLPIAGPSDKDNLAQADNPRGPSARPQKPKADDKKDVTITGRILDAGDEPVRGAQVAVLGSPQLSPMGLSEGPEVVGKTKADADGRYHLAFSSSTLARYRKLKALAAASGHGLGWHPFLPDQKEVDIHLCREEMIRVRLVDLQGQSAAGVKVYVGGVGKHDPDDATNFFFWDPPKGLPVWPGPVTTDAQGRLTLHGIGVDQPVALQVLDEPFARQWLNLANDGKQQRKETTVSLAPSQVVEGTITYADTGKPIPKARLHVQAGEEFGTRYGMDGQADEQGRFRINPFAGEIVIMNVFGPVGEPYLGLKKEVKWPKGAAKQTIDFVLPRGVLVRGKVEEAGAGKPVAGSVITYHPNRSNNPFLREDVLFERKVFSGITSGPDGAFDITVLPGKGHLLLLGPTADYVSSEIGSNQIDINEPGGNRLYYHGMVPLEVKPGAGTQHVKAAFRRGVTVRGRLLGPDGKPVAKALMLSPLNPTGRRAVEVREGSFELKGCDPEKSYPVYFLDPQNKLGATAEISGKQSGGQPMTVRLRPCGSAVARLVDADGKPVAGLSLGLQILVTPGAAVGDEKARKEGALLAVSELLANVDRLNYGDNLRTDVQGRITLPALIPGATYRLIRYDRTPNRDFKVESGQTLQLGDGVVE